MKKEYEVPEVEEILVESQTPIMQTTGGGNQGGGNDDYGDGGEM